MSVDDPETLKKFRASLSAPMSFVSDREQALVKAYDLKTPVLGWAKRTTFTIGEGRKVLDVQEGTEALEPAGAIRACSLHKPSPVDAATQPAAPPAWAPGADAGR